MVAYTPISDVCQFSGVFALQFILNVLTHIKFVVINNEVPVCSGQSLQWIGLFQQFSLVLAEYDVHHLVNLAHTQGTEDLGHPCTQVQLETFPFIVIPHNLKPTSLVYVSLGVNSLTYAFYSV